MKKIKSLTTKGLFRRKVLTAAVTLGIMSGCLMAAPVYAARIDDSKTFDNDTTIDGGNDNAVYIYDGKDAVVEIKQGTLTLKNDGDYPSVAVEENSKLTFKGDTVLIEKGDQWDDNAVIWVDDNCKLDFANAKTTITGYGAIGLSTGEGASISSNELLISNISTDDWHQGLELNSKSQFVGNGKVTINIENGKNVIGIYSDGASLTFNNDLIIKNTGNTSTESNIGINLIDNTRSSKKFLSNKNIDIDLQGGKDGTGFYSTHTNDIKVDGHLKINVNCDEVVQQVGNKGLYMTERSNFVGKTADITVSGKKGVALYGQANNYIFNNEKSTIAFSDAVKVNAEIAIFANSVKKNENVAVVDLQKDFISLHDNSQISVDGNSRVDINNNGEGVVQFSGIMGVFQEGAITTGDANININMNNGTSYWKLTGNSWMNTLNIANGAKLDMTADKDDNKFSKLYLKNLKGDGASQNLIKMDIDASKNADNSDRIYVKGLHNGIHYITLDNVAADGSHDGAEGTVLVSVKDEQGEFKAKDSEGTLFWNKYDLAKYEKANGDTVTEGYNTDWYLKEVEIIPAYPINPANPRPTTSVDAVDATQRLAFANWVEDDKLMQRMGDLRHETNNEEGVWVRVKGGKYSGDGFSNRHTMYQLGYDDVVKENEKLKRYQGVAFAYDDGKNSFNRGSGKLKAKSIGFYSTDLRNKGHYLDLAFKIYDADSDFTVFDTEGKKITGAFDNTGISLSAEYGRKKQLDEHWSIEPQAQLTLGYLGGARYTTSNGIHVSQSDPNSVLGRIGCNFMYDMDEKNTVYLKANWLHQFAGNYGATLTNGSESLRIDNHDHDTWFEYGLGFACMTGKNNHLYADVERSTGGSLRKDWQWNAGMFWTF